MLTITTYVYVVNVKNLNATPSQALLANRFMQRLFFLDHTSQPRSVVNLTLRNVRDFAQCAR